MPLAAYNDRFPRFVQFLRNAKTKARVAHAYLFIGEQEDLLRDFARAWVEVCACSQPAENGDACGNCDVCKRLTQRAYEELFILYPESKLRRVGVDSIRWLEHQLGMTAGGNRLKVGLIDEADCLTEQAQNAFLKTLEEPLPGTMLVLTTTRPRLLLPTIRSRCQNISLRENVRDYGDLIPSGIFDLLGQLQPASGSLRALSTASKLTGLFAGLRRQAEEYAGGEEDERWEHVAEGNKALQKRLDDQQKANLEAEYRRLRQRYLEAMQAWYMQASLLSSGVSSEAVPQQEMLPYMHSVKQGGDSPEIAQRNLRLVDDLIYYLSGNTDERLAIEAFCLAICEKD